MLWSGPKKAEVFQDGSLSLRTKLKREGARWLGAKEKDAGGYQ